jgi:uncharacterized protein (TIGR02145 family)
MRKLLFFTTFAALLVLGCSSNDDMPCLSCYGFYQQYAYCLVNYGYYGSRCNYMETSSCLHNGGIVYSDNACGGNLTQSSSSSRPSSSSSRSVSSSSVEYTGGSCNASDYGRVEIGDQVWMAKNWGCYAPGSKCYGNDPANCNTYGRLYDWATAMNIDRRYNYEEWGGSDVNHRGICPSGWHIPNNDDWDKLFLYVDLENDGNGFHWDSGGYESQTAGKYLKARNGWTSGGNGEDTYGFSALPGGYGNSNGYFYNVGDDGLWWSASEYSSYLAYNRGMRYDGEIASYYGYYDKNDLFSVRCLQD